MNGIYGEENARFKIDRSDSCPSTWPFALFCKERTDWLGLKTWRCLETFKTREDAVAYYDKIKDLPEYFP
jgi:hypothetical protein